MSLAMTVCDIDRVIFHQRYGTQNDRTLVLGLLSMTGHIVYYYSVYKQKYIVKNALPHKSLNREKQDTVNGGLVAIVFDIKL